MRNPIPSDDEWFDDYQSGEISADWLMEMSVNVMEDIAGGLDPAELLGADTEDLKFELKRLIARLTFVLKTAHMIYDLLLDVNEKNRVAEVTKILVPIKDEAIDNYIKMGGELDDLR